MSRHIDADALLSSISSHFCEDCDKRKGIKNGKIKTIYQIGDAPCRACWVDDMEGEIDSAPTIDAVEVIRCKDCLFYDKPHVEKDGERYEYSEMPIDAFDELGTGLVSTEYGINVGGKCCRDNYLGYSEDKSVFRETCDWCSKAERKEE